MDYRKLNLVTKADTYSIPRIKDMINEIGQASYITALDLTKGYLQVPVAKESQEKIAFITSWGKYQFVTMPFGLDNAPSTFQCLMDQLLEGTQAFTAAYLDDVIIYSRCWEEYLEHLREILTRLRKACLTIKESKCKCASNECEYLRHTLSNGKVHPLQAKVQSVQDFTQPITKKDVCAFLGLCGYYRHFIPDFSTI